jgi:hypothetical protein
LSFQNTLRGAGRPEKALASARTNLAPPNVPAAINWLRATPFRGNNIDLFRKPKSYFKLEQTVSAIGDLAIALCLKGVSDSGDTKKNDDFQPYASFVSAELLKALFEQHLFDTALIP